MGSLILNFSQEIRDLLGRRVNVNQDFSMLM